MSINPHYESPCLYLAKTVGVAVIGGTCFCTTITLNPALALCVFYLTGAALIVANHGVEGLKLHTFTNNSEKRVTPSPSTDQEPSENSPVESKGDESKGDETKKKQ